MIHNGGDSLTTVPLGIAFFLRSRRGELWAGYVIVAVILSSALLALYEVIGNEVAATIRWRAGSVWIHPL